jgi:hypothetical protein
MDLGINDAVHFNYLGAGVFWLYIVAALVLSCIAISTIVQLHPQRQAAPSEQDHRRTRQDDPALYFIVLASLSFATLSSNMLGVLIQSFLQWSQQAWVVRDLGSTSLIQRIWTWSITSTLFHDFGEAIVADNARYFWTNNALLITFAVCTYMGIEGV